MASSNHQAKGDETPLYCITCGAANEQQATYCFACQQPFPAPRGKLLKQRYQVISTVGEGGFGVVYQAEDTLYHYQRVAIKEINLGSLTPQEAIEATNAFNREVRMLAGLRHPSLPRMYDHFADRGRWYIVLDFIEGQTLGQYQKQCPSGCLSLEEVLNIGIQLCAVLEYLHTREPAIIYRDLKPSNIMRAPDGHLYLIDFGIARRFKRGKARDTMFLGSAGYAAPEQYGRMQTTPQTDIYSLGATLHQLFTGHDPARTQFYFIPLASLPSHSDYDGTAIDQFQALLTWMVELEPSHRPASVQDVRIALEKIVLDLSPPVGV